MISNLWPRNQDKNVKCPLAKSINSISGKWKPMILHMLSERNYFFAEIVKDLPDASKKIITSHLRELEADGLILRKITQDAKVRVLYSLSDRGQKLSPILAQLYIWGSES